MRSLITVLSMVFLVACGGGGGGGGGVSGTPWIAPSDTPFAQTFTASATAGEVLTFTFNSINKTYSYIITQSSYGLLGQTGSGTLTLNDDGSYAPSESPASKIYALQNGLIVGKVRLTLNGILQDVPIVGVANPATTGAVMAGTYNFISVQCANQSYGIYTACNTYYGTTQVVSTGATTGTYTTCTAGNMSGCSTTSTGTLTHISGGVWDMVRTGSANHNYMLAFQATNGQKVAVVDFGDFGGYGYGQAIAAEQFAPTMADVAGTYIYKNTVGTTGRVTIAAQSATIGTAGSLTLTANNPWTGIVHTNSSGGNGYGILAGSGVYAYRDPAVAAGYFELGMRRGY